MRRWSRALAAARWEHSSPSSTSGPVAGVIAGQFGYAAVYLFGAACALLGAALATARRPQS